MIAIGRCANKIVVCPICHSDLNHNGATLLCTNKSCSGTFPIVDGIPVLLSTGNQPQTHRIRSYYDNMANDYEAIDTFWQNEYDKATWRMENGLISEFMKDTAEIVDLGTGFYPHVESTIGRSVVCVDLSLSSLRLARAQFHNANPKMEYICADATHLPFSDSSIRATIAGGELANHLKLDLFIRELSRVTAASGRSIISAGMKWCLDSLYAIVDALSGNNMGYSISRNEAKEFLHYARSSSQVTWEIAPGSRLSITLYTKKDLTTAMREHGFKILAVRSLNVLSGIVPLPLQQRDRLPSCAQYLLRSLITADESVIGRIPGIRWFGGNVYLVLERS